VKLGKWWSSCRTSTGQMMCSQLQKECSIWEVLKWVQMKNLVYCFANLPLYKMGMLIQRVDWKRMTWLGQSSLLHWKCTGQLWTWSQRTSAMPCSWAMRHCICSVYTSTSIIEKLYIKPGPIETCWACTLAKAKQKHVVQFSVYEKSQVPGERVFFDLSSMQPTEGVVELPRANWRIIVDEGTHF